MLPRLARQLIGFPPPEQSPPARWRSMQVLAWLTFVAAFLNTAFFVWRVTSPVIQSDAWYFLDVFLRKAIAGDLTAGDFFVRRAGADHSQPLFKLALLFEWRYFDLDFMIEALIGVAAAVGSALLTLRIIFGKTQRDGTDWVRYLAWMTICALLFSLNADAGIWTWSLVSLEQVVTLCVLTYIAVAWFAISHQRYALLALATLLVSISCDDMGTFAAASIVLATMVGCCGDARMRQLPIRKILLVIVIPLIIVRIGYTFAPIVSGTKAGALSAHIGLLPHRFSDGGFWMWIAIPLVLPVYYQHLPVPTRFDTDGILFFLTAFALIIAHIAFWRRAFLGNYNAAIFVAVSLMLVTYAEIAGIVIGRVAYNGNDYLFQTRYVVRFVGHLIALLLMWSGSRKSGLSEPLRPLGKGLVVLLPSMGCLMVLGLQFPLSFHAWALRPYEWNYQAALANSVQTLTIDPANKAACLPEVRVCRSPPEKRRELAQLLLENHLNVFSPNVQLRHAQLPKLPSISSPATGPVANAAK